MVRFRFPQVEYIIAIIVELAEIISESQSEIIGQFLYQSDRPNICINIEIGHVAGCVQ